MYEQQERRNTGKRLKIYFGLVALAFAITLAIVVGNRLSEESLAVLSGAVCGVGAAIPTSLLILAVSRHRDKEDQQAGSYQQQQSHNGYPPVVVISPPNSQQHSSDWNQLPPSFSSPGQRQFTVVGGSAQDLEEKNGRYH